MSNPKEKITRNGKTLTARVWALIEDACREVGVPCVVMQGSYNKGVAASAGVHDGGGAVDLSVRGMTAAQINSLVVALRRRGAPAWARTARYGWTKGDHIHALIRGEDDMSPQAKRQLAQFDMALDGLKGGRHDPFPRPAWTLFKMEDAVGKADDDWLSLKDTKITKIQTNTDIRVTIDGKAQFTAEKSGRGTVAQYVNVKLPPPGSPERAALERGIVRTWFQQIEKGKAPDITGLDNARRVGLWGTRRLTFKDSWPHTKSTDRPWEFCFFIEAWSESGEPMALNLDMATREVKIVSGA